MFNLLIGFFRQPVTILGELAPHEKFSQTSGIIPLNGILLIFVRFQDGRE